jgi:hypothetical protein
MEVWGNLRTKVEIDPIDVLTSLRGAGYWYTEENGRYYRNFEVGAGQHSFDDKEEITKEEYDYHMALKTVISYLKKEKKNGN